MTKFGMAAEIVDGLHYRHVVYIKNSVPVRSDTLQIYIDGDGRPWRYGREVSEDPTPHRPLALLLMAQDPEVAVYLGRPCYFGRSLLDDCNAEDWTSGRYSQKVVDSMVAASRNLQRRFGANAIRLIGYSGGGSLATLMAEQLDGVELVVTLAANLDIDAWTERHHYLALDKSLNPILARGDRRCAVHISGDRDENVPPDMVERYVSQRGGMHLNAKGQDHACCWRDQWPVLLAEVNALAKQAGCI